MRRRRQGRSDRPLHEEIERLSRGEFSSRQAESRGPVTSRAGQSRGASAIGLRLLIDGYNLLYAIGFGNMGTPSAVLAHARQELLDFLTRTLTLRERQSTLIVFDAKRAPYGSEPQARHAEMTIRFAVDYLDADELIKELIRAHHTPQKLCVVSSDHGIQVVAERRGAKPIDCDQWHDRLHARQKRAADPPGDARQDDLFDKPLDALGSNDQHPFPPRYVEEAAQDFDLRDETWHPFPPGYGEDVIE